jgi:tRNA dimethylallyltransferase
MSTAAPVRLIAGPTASGKSALAVAIARETGAVIVNADSMQLYRDLRILTARPTEAEEAQAEHRLYGIADAADAWSVGRWLRAVTEVLGRLRAEGRGAIVVGGTGLYFRALTRGLADIPPVPDDLREAVAARLQSEGEAGFRAALEAVDPAAADRIAAGDRQRLIRAFSVHAATGVSLTDWAASTTPTLAPGDWEAVVVEPERGELYRRCDARLDRMLEEGVLSEIAALAGRALNGALPIMKATGLREFMAYLDGRVSLDEALDAARRETRRYAKRQLTWFRNQTPDWPRRRDANC